MIFERAKIEEFESIKQFYWNLSDSRKTLYKVWISICSGKRDVL